MWWFQRTLTPNLHLDIYSMPWNPKTAGSHKLYEFSQKSPMEIKASE